MKANFVDKSYMTERAPINLKILTVNTHKGFTAFNRRFILHELRDAIRDTEADVVFLQEVLGAHAQHAARLTEWPSSSQYEFLADTIWDAYAYGRNAVYPFGHHGNALLSKFQILSYDNIDISVGKHEKRGLLHCVLDVPGAPQQVHAICVHLGLQEKHRTKQLNFLCELIHEQVPPGAPLVVAGDFNDWRLKGQHVLANHCGLTEVFKQHFGHLMRTFPSRFPILRLDRIYVRGVSKVSPVSLAKDPWGRLSDHAPLAVELQL